MISDSPEKTKRIAAEIAKRLRSGDVIALEGDLGSGKTTFVQGLAVGLGVAKEEYVRSPTFTIVNEYEGKSPLYHIDLYRLGGEDEIEALGLEEYFEGDGVTVVEWADRFRQSLPERTKRIAFKVVDEMRREIDLPEEWAKCS